MKKIFLIMATVMLLASCLAQLNEKVEMSYPSGKPQVVRCYDKHNQCVKEIEYYESGQVKMEGGMKDGKMEGEWTAYFPDGRVQSKGIFKDGKRTGAATVYFNNGNLMSEGFYTDGKHSGHWKWYDEQGNLLREEDYPE